MVVVVVEIIIHFQLAALAAQVAEEAKVVLLEVLALVVKATTAVD
jgi:hypothetical protein